MLLCFFFKQKTAYEMRISDWSSDVCSSDLIAEVGHVAVELEALDEALSGFLAALDLERRHRAEAPTRAVLLAPLVPARGREAGVGHRDRKSVREGKSG